MKQYPKIQTIFKRDMANKGRIMFDSFATVEIGYLATNLWEFTEKVDGTNIRIEWVRGVGRKFGGRTDNANIPARLIERLEELFPLDKMDAAIHPETDSLTLYGEGFGAKIQKGGGNYKPDGVDFVLFDVLVDEWWLRRDAVQDVAKNLSIGVVPTRGYGSLMEAVEYVRNGFDSEWGSFLGEGLVLRPTVELQTRAGHRIITKIKCRDFDVRRS